MGMPASWTKKASAHIKAGPHPTGKALIEMAWPSAVTVDGIERLGHGSQFVTVKIPAWMLRRLKVGR